jgi:O-antigen ligase
MKILEWGIYLIVFCLPLYLLRFSIFNIPTTVLELMIYALFVFWLIKVKWTGIKEVIIKIRKIILPIILILIGVSVATIFSWNLRASAGIWKAWFIDPILFFIVIVSVVKNSEQIKKIFYSLIFSGFVVSVISLIYLIQGKLDASGRLQAFYTSPNYLAMYLAPVLIASFWVLFFRFPRSAQRAELRVEPSAPPTSVGDHARFGLKTRSRTIPKTILLIINCLLLIVVLLLTKSFGAWLGIIVALVFGLIVCLPKIKPAQCWSASGGKIIWGIIFCLLAIVLIFGFLKINSIQGKLSLSSRLEIWQRAWQVFKIYPIVGIGPGTFEDFFVPYPRWGVPQPHNLYLAFLLQAGIIGFIGFVWLVVWFFQNGFKNLFKVYNSKFMVILMSVMIYVLIHGLVDTTYWKNDLSVMFWLFIGLMAVFIN